MANTAIPIYKIQEDAQMFITNPNAAITKEYFVYGKDDKVETPDAGRITKFGPALTETEGEHTGEKYIVVPGEIRLPLYRAGAGTTITIPAGDTIIITPTLSEEVAYYKAACEALKLTFNYSDGQ